MTTFTQKALEIQIELTSGQFGGRSGNTKTLRGLACEAKIEKTGFPDKNKATMSIWGMNYEDMAELTRLFNTQWEPECHKITLSAGDEGGALSVAFKGEITQAYAKFDKAPDVCMHIVAMTGAYAAMQAEKPQSIKGEAQVAPVVEQLAGQMGYKFQNHGVSASVKNTVLNGSPLKKAQDLVSHVLATLLLDDDVLILMPRDDSRPGAPVRITPYNGLLGYPGFTENGLKCRCLYHPDLQHAGLVAIDSTVPGATGTWKITKLTHYLHAYKSPQGGSLPLWESEVEAVPHEK